MEKDSIGFCGKALVASMLGALAVVGLFLGPATAKRGGGGVPQDYRLMYEEYQAAGGLGFLHKTEELLRLAEFEQALMRYRFLKGQVAGQTEYRPVVVSINQRLHLLKRQMHLTEADISPLPRRRVALPPKPEPKPPPALEKAKAAEPGAAPPPAPAEPTGPQPQTPPVVEPGTGAPPAPGAPPAAGAPPAHTAPATPTAPGAPGTPGSAAAPAASAPPGGAPAPPPAAKGEAAPAPAEAAPAPPVKKSFWHKVKGLLGR